MTVPRDLAEGLEAIDAKLADVEETARALHKAVDVGIDVAEVAQIGRMLDARIGEVAQDSTFLRGTGAVEGAFATCNGVAYSLAGHAKAAVGFGSMAHRSTWKSRWDNVWSEWLRALAWRDHVLADEGISLPYRVAGGSDEDVLGA